MTKSLHNIVDERRAGKFTVSREFISRNLDIFFQAMADTLIVDARGNFIDDVIEYQAFSACFDPLRRGEQLPFYNLIVKQDQDDAGNITYSFQWAKA